METDCLLRGTDRVVISPKILFLKSLTVVFLSPTESAQLVPKFALFTACPIYSPQYINIKTQPKFSSHSDTPICSFSTRHSAVHLFIFLIFQLTFLRRTSGQNVETLTFVDFQCPCNNTLFLTPPLPLSSLNSVYACQNAVRLFCPQVTPFPDNNKKCKFGFTGSAKGDTVSGVTQCCCTAISGVAQCCCTAISGVAQCSCTAVSGVAQCCCTAISGVAQCCCTAVSGVAQCCCTAVSGAAQCCCTAVTGAAHCCCTAVSGVAQCCCTSVSGLAQCCCTAVSGVAQCCFTAVSGEAQCCFTAVSGVAQCCCAA